MNMQEIARRKKELEARVTAIGYQATERDVAEAVELVNAYIDELERLEQTAMPYKGADIDGIADIILERWYPHE